MPNESSIATYVSAIENAVYGREVRGAIANGIRQCYTDVSNSVTLADQCISECNDLIDEMTAKISEADSAITNAGIATSTAITAAEQIADTASLVMTSMAASVLTTLNYLEPS